MSSNRKDSSPSPHPVEKVSTAIDFMLKDHLVGESLPGEGHEHGMVAKSQVAEMTGAPYAVWEGNRKKGEDVVEGASGGTTCGMVAKSHVAEMTGAPYVVWKGTRAPKRKHMDDRTDKHKHISGTGVRGLGAARRFTGGGYGKYDVFADCARDDVIWSNSWRTYGAEPVSHVSVILRPSL